MSETENLPSGWSLARIEDICSVNPGKTRQEITPETLVSFVPMPAVSAETGDIVSPVIREYSTVAKGYTAFENDDVLMAKITPCMENGKAAIARNLESGLGFGSTEFHVLRTNGSALPEYVFAFIRQESFRRNAERNMTGSVGQKRVPASFLSESEIPLPPINEQRRIVAKLDRVLTKVDACRARLDTIPVTLKRFRQSVLAAACSGRLTADWREQNPDLEAVKVIAEPVEADDLPDLPEKWFYTRLRSVEESLKYGTSQKCQVEEIGVAVLRIPNVAAGHIDQTNLKYADLPPREYAQLKLQEGDILMIRSNGSVSLVGKTAMVSAKEVGLAYAGYLMRLRVERQKVEPEFVDLALGSFHIRKQIEIPARSTSGVNNINSDEVRALVIPLPPLEEQRKIVRRVQQLFAWADSIEARYKKARRHFDKVAQATLAKAFRGELVPQDPDDEPASELLERIRAGESAKEATTSTRKGRGQKKGVVALPGLD